MLSIYWGCLITGVMFALVTVLFGEVLDGVWDGIFESLSLDSLDFLSPTVLVGGITIFGGAGIMLPKGTADADVIRLKGLAEAEAKEKLAEAFQKFGEAAVLDIIAKMLPELAGQIADPLKSIDKLTVVDTGNGEEALRVSNYVTSLMATGIDQKRLFVLRTFLFECKTASLLSVFRHGGSDCCAYP